MVRGLTRAMQCEIMLMCASVHGASVHIYSLAATFICLPYFLLYFGKMTCLINKTKKKKITATVK